MSQKLPGEEKPSVYNSWAEFIGKFLALVVISAITLLIVSIVIWALIKIGQDLRESL